jgi:hypothetical protein
MIAFADGVLDAAEAQSIRQHLDLCTECRTHIDDLRQLEDLVSEADAAEDDDSRASREQPLPRSLDDAFDRVIRTHVGGGASRFPVWRPVTVAAAAVAAGFMLWIGLRPKLLDAPEIAGWTAYEASAGNVRGAADSTYHFELTVDRPTHLAIFRVAEGTVTLIYPDPNPHLATFGRSAPFAAGEKVRIPPTALADYAAERTEGLFLAVPMARPETAESLAPLLAEMKSLAKQGLDAVRARLRSRFGAVADLPRK